MDMLEAMNKKENGCMSGRDEEKHEKNILYDMVEL